MLENITSPSKKQNYYSNAYYPTPEQIKHLIKPDFSPLLIKENKFIAKTSYKIPKTSQPESPMKTPNSVHLSPKRIKGKDLFGVKQIKNYCKKLNFDEEEKKDDISNDNIDNNNKKDINNNYNNFLFQCPNYDTYEIEIKDDFIDDKRREEKNLMKSKEKDNRMENEYTIMKTIYENKLDAIYQVKENKTGNIFCLKKISEKSDKNNFRKILTTLEDIQKENRDWKFHKTFCVKYIDYWVENKNNDSLNADSNYINKNIYILTPYYKNGDVLDYLGQLEINNFTFTPEFYWDMIFEMMIGLLYIHKKGYIHFDIKPTNYLVDDNGYILINDFGLSYNKEELRDLDDIKEGDSKYISKELFECYDNNSLKKIDFKTDIFSLGLTLLEILAKIEIPSNGHLWRCLRELGGNILTEKIFYNSNVVGFKDFFGLIKKMISPINKRPTLLELIKETLELNKRYELMEKNIYEKFANINVNKL